jgi:hypothetical protein
VIKAAPALEGDTRWILRDVDAFVSRYHSTRATINAAKPYHPTMIQPYTFVVPRLIVTQTALQLILDIFLLLGLLGLLCELLQHIQLGCDFIPLRRCQAALAEHALQSTQFLLDIGRILA